MFAVFRTGGKQYRVAEDNVLRVDKIDGILVLRHQLNALQQRAPRHLGWRRKTIRARVSAEHAANYLFSSAFLTNCMSTTSL